MDSEIIILNQATQTLSHLWVITCNVYVCTHMQTYIHLGEERGKDTGGVQVRLRIAKGGGDEEGRKSTKVHLENIITISNTVYSHFLNWYKKIPIILWGSEEDLPGYRTS